MFAVNCNVSNSSRGAPSPDTTFQTYLLAFKHQGTALVDASYGTVPGFVDVDCGIDLFKANGQDFIQVVSALFDEYYVPVNPDSSQLTMTLLQLTGDVNDLMPLVSQRTALGKPGDVVHSTLSHGNYTVVTSSNEMNSFTTFNRSDPTNPHQPIVGMIMSPGQTKSLHAVGQNLVLGIGYRGQNSSWNVELSLFDVPNISQPRLIDQWSDVPQTDNASQYVCSDVEFSSKAFHYVFERQLLIVPLSVTTLQQTLSFDKGMSVFDGFRVFKINAASGITEHFSIDQSSNDDFGSCFLRSRSFVFDNNVITLRGHLVLSHSLSTMLEVAPAIKLKEGSDCARDYSLETQPLANVTVGAAR